MSAETDHPSKRQRQDVLCCINCKCRLKRASYARIKDGPGHTSCCPHTVCLLCLSEIQDERSANLQLSCPGKDCSLAAREYSVFEYKNSAHQPPREQKIRLPNRRADLTNHPTQYFINKSREYRDGHAVVSVSVINGEDMGSSVSYVAELKKNEADTDEHNAKQLERIGRSLHPFLQRAKADKGSQSYLTYANPNAISIGQLEAEDDSLLRRFLHGIGVGTSFKRASDRSPFELKPLYQKEYNSSYVATEVTRSAKGGGHRSSTLKNVVSDLLTATNVKDGVIKFFGRIGLCKSKTYITLSSDRAVEEKVKRGWDPRGRGYGIIVGAYDNIGFRKVKAYVQYTLLSILFYNVAYLISIGVYPDPTLSPTEALEKSTYRNPDNGRDWSSVMSEYEFELTDEDSAMLAREVTLPTIQFVLDAMTDAEGGFPTLEEAKAFLTARDDISFGTKVPHNATARRSVKLPDEDLTAEAGAVQVSTDAGEVTNIQESQLNNVNDYDEDFIGEGAGDEAAKTIYSLNNATIDVPMQQDLNAISTVKSIMMYYGGLASRCLSETFGCDYKEDILTEVAIAHEKASNPHLKEQNPWAFHGWPQDKWPEPWMQRLGPILCGDGQPTFGMLRLRDTDPEFTNKHFSPFNGGFHTMLELHKMRGKLFGPSHLRQIWKLWRASEAQLNWVMSPGDPNQVDDELIWYHFALIAAAILALLEDLQEENLPQDISAVDVHDFMLRRAKGCAITMSVLNEMRYAEVVLLLHQAEESADAEKFVTALKFATTLITTTHATKYTYIHAKFLLWWHCASDAEKTIYEEIVLTKKTVKRKNIFTDRFVEWMVKDVRDTVGKHHRAGTRNKLFRETLLLDEKKQLQDQFRETFRMRKDEDDGDGGEEEERMTLSKHGKVYCEVLAFASDNNLWKSINRELLALGSDWPPTNPEMIDGPLEGIARANTYINMRFKNAVTDEAEKEKKDSELLRSIQPTREQQLNNDDICVERAVSTTFPFVKLNYKLTELKVVYRELQSSWDAEAIGSPFPKKGKENNKDEYTNAIINARKLLKDHDSNWEQNRKLEIEQQNEERNSNATNSIGARLDRMAASNFCDLYVSNRLRELYSKRQLIRTTAATANIDSSSSSNGGDGNNQARRIKLKSRKRLSFGNG